MKMNEEDDDNDGEYEHDQHDVGGHCDEEDGICK